MLTDEQLDSLRVGDVIDFGSCWRMVRDMTRKNGRPHYFTFSIRRCSWTQRPFTVFTRTDLKWRGQGIVVRGLRPIRSKTERLLQKEIKDGKIRCLDCCDVIGVVD